MLQRVLRRIAYNYYNDNGQPLLETQKLYIDIFHKNIFHDIVTIYALRLVIFSLEI